VTREEHSDIREFIDRVVSGEQPPLDVEADAIIRALFVRNPDAAYRMTMLALALANTQLATMPPLTAPIRAAGRSRESRLWISSLFGRRTSRRPPHGAVRG
jgi:hypothetical protein